MKRFGMAAGLTALCLFSCGGDALPGPEGALSAPVSGTAVGTREAGGAGAGFGLEELAEAERLGGFAGGMGLRESALREEAGDYGGAVIAAWKELAWAFSRGLLPEESLRRGLESILTLREGTAGVAEAAGAVLAFVDGDWKRAGEALRALFPGGEAGDGLVRWLLLVCDMEGGPPEAAAGAGAVYGSIRARYANFPEYWYRGARYFSGPIGAEYADRCIALAPQGPYAAECRGILGAWLGLQGRDAAAVKSRAEIEGIIARAAGTGNPEPLAELLPLIGLPDNTYTFFAAGSLRALSGEPPFRDYLLREAAGASGRLAERLNYICRGR